MHTCIKSLTTELNVNGMKDYLLFCLGWPESQKYRSQNHMEIVMEV